MNTTIFIEGDVVYLVLLKIWVKYQVVDERGRKTWGRKVT